MCSKKILLKEEQVLKIFEEEFKKSKKSSERSDFYCGITNNLERRASEHNIKNYICYLNVSSFESAKNIEAKLAKQGFDCGDQLGNGDIDSVFVYMCYKDSDFNK